MVIGCANHKELTMNFDKKIVRIIEGEKAEYGFLFGNENKVFTKYNNLDELAEALGLPKGPDITCALNQFMKSLDFVKQTKKFKMADIQRNLQCGYGTACKVVDALCALWVIEKQDTSPISFVRLNDNL